MSNANKKNNRIYINPRQLLIHSLAALFFLYAFELFAYSINVYAIEIIQQCSRQESPMECLRLFHEKHRHVAQFYQWTSKAPLFGFTLAFLISLSTSIYHRRHWINACLVWLIVFVLYQSGMTGWLLPITRLQALQLPLQNKIMAINLKATLLLIPGCLLFFLPIVNRFIQHRTAGKAINNNTP